MNWPMSFCIVGTSWSFFAVLSYVWKFKRYRLEVMAKALVDLERARVDLADRIRKLENTK